MFIFFEILVIIFKEVKEMADKVKKVKIAFNVNACPCHKVVYICGNIAELGEWDASKAVKLEFSADANCYVVSKMLPEGVNVEYKVLADKDWSHVECGSNGSEVANHSFSVAKGHVEIVSVESFK